MHQGAALILAAGLVAGVASATFAAAEDDDDTLSRQALAAFRKGEHTQALKLAGEAIAKAPDKPEPLALRAQLHGAMRAHDKAAADLTAALELEKNPGARADLFQRRGESQFKRAKIKESIADFDAFLKVQTAQDPHHWQRGISYYYAGEFQKGYEQFERHQTVNPNDVENAVWHFLCLARARGIKEATEKLIPIEGDGRIPMMEVHALFAGKSTPEKILAKAGEGEAKGERLERQLFYAHLYLGLWYEAKGDLKLRDKYIGMAAAVADRHSYMGDVARVHAQLRGIKPAK